MKQRYYWLKLQEDFFTSKRIKKLRKEENGDTCCIIYLKMQLLAIKNDGYIHFSGLEDTFIDELALDLDEDEEIVEQTLNFLIKFDLIETSDDVNFFVPFAVENTGSESTSAQRMRNSRAKKAEETESKMSQNDTNVTEECHNVQKCDTNVSQCAKMYAQCDGDIDKDIDKDIDNIYIYADSTQKKAAKTKKHKCGKYQNVLLTEEEEEKLKEKYPKNYQKYIDHFSESLVQYGYKYKCHYLAIMKWHQNDDQSVPVASYDLDEFTKRALSSEIKYEKSGG